MAKTGRPPKAGERYPGGQLKPEIAPALLVRIRTAVERGYADPRLGSQVGRLLFHRELSPIEATAAFRIGEIYGRFERNNGLRRTTRSPSYEMGNAGGMNGQALDQDAVKADTEAWLALQDALVEPATGHEVDCKCRICRRRVSLIERLCVDDEPLLPLQLEEVRKLLRQLAHLFKAGRPKKKKKKRPALMVVAGAASPSPAPAKTRRINQEREAWLAVQRRLSPNLNEHELSKAYDEFLARKDRGDFNDHEQIAPPQFKPHQPLREPFQKTLTLPPRPD